uniref:Uncharacterized protein n=1 Tax=Anguilla anguilla TaxID=7936 RepID=A0A0E9S7B6_ANGAN
MLFLISTCDRKNEEMYLLYICHQHWGRLLVFRGCECSFVSSLQKKKQRIIMTTLKLYLKYKLVGDLVYDYHTSVDYSVFCIDI